MAEYADNWMSRPWNVISPFQGDPQNPDVLLFTEDTAGNKTIERCQVTQSTQGPALLKLEDWATGCTWDDNNARLSGTHGSQTFVISRNGTTLTCTWVDTTARRRQQVRSVLFGTFSGGLAGLLTGLGIGVQPVEAVAVGLSASLLSALMAAGSTPWSGNEKVGDTWVANEGGAGLPPPPHTSTDGTERRIKASPLRTAEA
jgi:hypothetical protein